MTPKKGSFLRLIEVNVNSDSLNVNSDQLVRKASLMSV
ncbi:hypothetical protein BH09BAC4_BH09BAC4_03490 [soil metagenome]